MPTTCAYKLCICLCGWRTFIEGCTLRKLGVLNFETYKVQNIIRNHGCYVPINLACDYVLCTSSKYSLIPFSES